MRPIEDWGRGGWPAIGTGAAGGIRAMIEVKGLSFTYTGAENPAVNDLEFAVEDGEIFGFLGPNGVPNGGAEVGIARGAPGSGASRTGLPR